MNVGTIRILLVDDEAEFSRSLSKVLARRGFSVEVFADGASALRRAPAGGFDAVLLDVKMPGMDGIAVLAALKRLAPALPVILMTGNLSAEDEERGLKAGARAYVLKPHPIDDLAALVRRAVGETVPAGGR